MPEITCRCVECDASLIRTGPRIAEWHMSMRFGDDRLFREQGLRCYLDGEDVTDSAYESIAGAQGAVWVHTKDETGAYHRCTCGGDVCSAVRRGFVEVRRALVEA